MSAFLLQESSNSEHYEYFLSIVLLDSMCLIQKFLCLWRQIYLEIRPLLKTNIQTPSFFRVFPLRFIEQLKTMILLYPLVKFIEAIMPYAIILHHELH